MSAIYTVKCDPIAALYDSGAATLSGEQAAETQQQQSAGADHRNGSDAAEAPLRIFETGDDAAQLLLDVFQ